MDRIVGIIDMDGFVINKKFHCRELGIIEVGKEEGRSYLFDIGIRWQDLSIKDRKSCLYVMKHIHKLSLNSPPGSFQLRNLKEIVKDFYENVKINGESTLAYKGGHIELDLLKELCIPTVNLEAYGCPKAEYLFDKLVWLETCPNHIATHAYKHCPKVEVEAFAAWLKETNL